MRRQKPGYLRNGFSFGFATSPRSLSGFGASGNMQWYIGQHGKVRQSLVNNDLKGAIDAAVSLDDLGISGKTSDQVLNDADSLRTLKQAITVQHAPAGFYTRDSINLYQKDAAAIAAQLIDQAIQAIAQRQAAAQQAAQVAAQQAQMAAQQAQMAQQAQQAPQAMAPSADLQAQYAALQAEAAKVGAVAVAIPNTGAVYTGGGGGGGATPPPEEKPEDPLQKLVDDYETNKAIQRASSDQPTVVYETDQPMVKRGLSLSGIATYAVPLAAVILVYLIWDSRR